MTLLLLVAIVAVAALLRLPELATQSLWYDEAATWHQVNGSLLDVFIETANDNYPPLYNVLAWVSLQLFGDSEWALRLPAALLGVAAVPMIYLCGARIADRLVGLFAALLLALSSFHIWYSGEARMYTLLLFAATAHVHAIVGLLKGEGRRARLWVVCSGLMLLFSHPYGTLVWLAIAGGAVVAAPRPLSGYPVDRFIRLQLMTLAPFMLWGLMLLWRAYVVASGGFWIPPMSLEWLIIELQSLTNALALPLAALALFGMVATRSNRAIGSFMPLLLLWALGPLIVAIVASLTIKPVLLARYLLGCLPALLLLASIGLARLPTLRSVPVFGTAATMVLGIGLLLLAPQATRHDFRAATAYLQPLATATDCVIAEPNYNTATVRYYGRELPCVRNASALPREMSNRPSGDFYVVQGNSEAGEPPRSMQPLLESGWMLAEVRHFHRVDVLRFTPQD